MSRYPADMTRFLGRGMPAESPELAAAIGRGAHSSEEARLLAELLERFTALPSGLRQTLADQLWAEIPTYVNETGYAQSLNPGSGTATLAVQAQFSGGIEVIDGVVATVATGATAVLQLGSTLIPIGAGVFNPSGVRFILGPTDTRSLTVTGAAGPASLWLTGRQVPTTGALST